MKFNEADYNYWKEKGMARKNTPWKQKGTALKSRAFLF
jgi:hypothetical protein